LKEVVKICGIEDKAEVKPVDSSFFQTQILGIPFGLRDAAEQRARHALEINSMRDGAGRIGRIPPQGIFEPDQEARSLGGQPTCVKPRVRVPAQPTAHGVCSVGTLLGIMVAVGSCANGYPADLVPPVPSETAAPEFYRTILEPSYMIGPGDSLLIQSYYHPDLKQPVTVQTDGRVSLLLVGDVMAAGKTPEQLAGELTRAYAKFLENADLTVTLSESAGLSVYVSGEVARPAMQPIRGELTLLQSTPKPAGFCLRAISSKY
jgi:hypothetical protein